MNKINILIFGVGILQRSIIERARKSGLFVVGIDPCIDAFCKDAVDVFERVDGQDFETTIAIAKKYHISAIVTAATDKPLVMMARVAKELYLPFYSVETAKVSTDKQLMKQKFIEYKVPCAKGFVLTDIEGMHKHDISYPVIVKPRDNSGSRGVIFCNNEVEVMSAWHEAMQYTHMPNILVEEYIDGPEYSIESVHVGGKSTVVQFTQKLITDFPYNVELGHIQPAVLSKETQQEIREVIQQIGVALKFDNCCSHTELKVSSSGIKVIETSPRLGGDFITSHLIPLSTGINIEDILLRLSLGERIEDNELLPISKMYSGVKYFCLPEGEIEEIKNVNKIKDINGVQCYNFDLNKGDKVNKITSSLNRYGFALFQTKTRDELLKSFEECDKLLSSAIIIK